MNSTLRSMLAAALLATAAFAPAMAQETATVGTLHVNSGQIMVSTNGGDFASVSGDTAVHIGDRIQVNDASDANLTYNNGYVLHYVSPGVYEVQAAPAGAQMASSGGASATATAAITLGAAALAAAGLDQKDNVPPDHPVSR